MTDKVFGLTEAKVQELVQKYSCIINRSELVPVVTVEWLEKYFKEHYLPYNQDILNLLEAARKEALK